jgi:hypothetical protein
MKKTDTGISDLEGTATIRHIGIPCLIKIKQLPTKTKPWILLFAISAMQRGTRLGGFENHTAADLEPRKPLNI